ncbi:MAG: ABC transporter ATP-binding protein [Bacillota bacterium]
MVKNSFLAVDNLAKHYGSTRALEGVSLTVNRGQWLSIMGSSGSGKSTLLNLLGGLNRPTSGTIVIDEVNLTNMSEDELARFRREKVGFVFQQHHLIPYLTALENIMLAQYFHSLPDENEAKEALGRVGLGHRLHHRPNQLSGGEQQRVCIARALINSPALLLADELTGNLDKENTTLVMNLLQQLHNEDRFTIIVVTHNHQVAKWGERLLTMEHGRITGDEIIAKKPPVIAEGCGS